MGRFFETAPTQFVEDFIYQPPWELIQQNNLLEAQNYETQKKTANLLNTIPIQNWDKPDSELARAKQEEYKNLAEPIIQTLQTDPNNKEAQLKLHDLTNKAYQDYVYGDIAKLRKNKEVHDKFMAIADTIKDPQAKEIFLKQEGNYLKYNADGSSNNALTKQFDYMEAQPLRNLPTEFLSSDAWKSLEASMEAGEDVKIGNTWLSKTGYSTEELKSKIIQQAYKHWLEGENLDKGNWAPYMSKLAGIEGLVDEEGKLRWDENSYLGRSISTVGDTYKYKKSKSTKDVDMRQDYLQNNQAALQERAAVRQHKRDLDVARASAITPSNDPSVPVYTDKLFSGHGDIETFIDNTFRNSAKRLGITPREYMSRIRMNPDKFKGTWSMQKLEEIDKMASNLRIANKDDFEKKYPGRGQEIQQLFINNAKLGNQQYLIPSNNSTHESYKRSFNDLRNGKITINGIKPKKGTAQIISSEIMIIPASTFEGSTIVYPVEFQDTKGEVHTEYIYKNVAEAYKQK